MNDLITKNKFTRNNLKVKFGETIHEQFTNVPSVNRIIKIHYKLYVKDKCRRDLRNFTSVISKFFEDCLTKEGVIPDDNVNVIGLCIDEYCGIDKGNPRIEADVYM